MSNFDTYTSAIDGLVGTAPMIWVASTDDSLATITTAGYMDDLVGLEQTAVNDLWYINYDVDGTEAAQLFTVEFDGTNYNLVAEATQQGVLLAANNLSDLISAATARTNLGLGTSAVKAASASGQATVASVSGATVAGNLVKAADTAGTIQDAAASFLFGTTAAFGGGGASNAFVATGLSASHVVVPVTLNSTNPVSILKAVPSANTLTVSFSADPGAATTVNWIAFLAS